ncbi:MAG: dinitrogenase iron-molybdenum cofactor biosynthesis protein [Elusimicrobiota bacterium]|jgi:predicted Fe-Mo cluster-binding NifX family protein|nr:dinitrogenase iron-molybdenum cofactor biosynthesis protein [Elusimicrobiota bacterium]
MSKIKIALASSDGVNIDTHFGKCRRFSIIEMDTITKEFTQVEIRKSERMCGPNGHTQEALNSIKKLLYDCSYVIVARIGIWIVEELKQSGITAIEFVGEVKSALNKIKI